MHARRHYFAAAFATDGKLYAAGGFEWSGQLASAEVYDARADRWRPLPDFVEGGAVLESARGRRAGRDFLNSTVLTPHSATIVKPT